MTKTLYDPQQDERFSHPVLDREEDLIRELIDGRRLPFHYVHGEFVGTDVRFSFCLPTKKDFLGRFFHFLCPYPAPDEETAALRTTGADDKIGFAISHGSAYVESNMGVGGRFDNNPHMKYQSSAATAEYFRTFAMDYYGCTRPFGYVYGGSGGSLKTMSCIENCTAWDGAVPYVIGSPAAMPYNITIGVHAQRVLRNALPRIADALEPGGSGDPYADLNADEADALREATRMGIPLRAWLDYPHMGPWALPVLLPGLTASDPSFVEDFWSKPGYLGTEKNSSAVKDRIQLLTRITKVFLPTPKKEFHIESESSTDEAYQKMISDGGGEEPAWIELEITPEDTLSAKSSDIYPYGIVIRVETGKAAGRTMLLQRFEGHRAFVTAEVRAYDLPEILSLLKEGDEVTLDNSAFLAFQTYHRHQCPGNEFSGWDQFRDETGAFRYAQRSSSAGQELLVGGAGSIQDGQIQCKTIILCCLLDPTFPWQGDWYRRKIQTARQTTEDQDWNDADQVRLWYMDNCYHDDRTAVSDEIHVTTYVGALKQALLDLSDWVERGIAPAPSTNYRLEENQISIPQEADKRAGIQPTVSLLANGANCIQIKAGETVTLSALAAVPLGQNMDHHSRITFLEFAPESEQDYPIKADLKSEDDRIHASATITHCYKKPGTYFAAVRVKAERHGNANDPYTQVQNICRARIIVRE